MSYSEIAARATADSLRHLGEDAVYHSASAGDISMVADDGEGVIMQYNQELEDEGGVLIRRNLARVKAGLVTASRDDSLTVNGVTYSVEQQLGGSDGYMITLVLGRRQ